ncbi:MAG TPA: glycosyltransferase [Candidatus Scybalocola faecipullorum]|nr:glycosyltransferase [Candidatus Scybalocola faecipullorum]
MLLSIIIPVYNVEKHLNECIDSILSQPFQDYEIILVDDGSTDSSGSICDYYKETDVRIKVFHKVNGGPSDARNQGIKLAKGEYLLFIDSDDYIERESLSTIVSCLERQKEKIDVMFLEACKVFHDGTKMPLGDGYYAEKINGKPKEMVMKHLAGLPKYPGSACTKLIRRKLIIDNNIYFEKGLLSEDIDWTIRVLIEAQHYAYNPSQYYYYRQNRYGSITNTAGLKSVESLLYIVKKWGKKESEIDNQDEINAFLSYEYMIALYNYSRLPKEDKRKVVKDLVDYKWIMSYGLSKKPRFVNFLVKCIGVQMTAILLNLGYRNR